MKFSFNAKLYCPKCKKELTEKNEITTIDNVWRYGVEGFYIICNKCDSTVSTFEHQTCTEEPQP